MGIFVTRKETVFGSHFKLGPWLSFPRINNEAQTWIGTEHVNQSARFNPKRSIGPPSILDYLIARAERADKLTHSLSGKQLTNVQQAILEGDLLSGGLPMFAAILAACEMFG